MFYNFNLKSFFTTDVLNFILLHIRVLFVLKIIVFSFFVSYILFKYLLFSNVFLNLFFFKKLVISIIIILCILLCVAFFTLVERKIMGFMQRRRGPNVVGLYGILQPIAEGVKLIFKETILPLKASTFLFLGAPLVTFFLSLIS